MINAIIRVDTDQIVVIGKCRAQYGQNYRGSLQYVDNYRKDLREETLGKCKIMEVSIKEVDIEAIIETTILEEVKVGLGKESIQIILEGMIEAVVVDQDQV